MIYPAFLFDMDGVLIDTKEWHWKAWQEFQKKFPAFHFDHETFLKGFGKTNDLFLQDIAPNSSKEERKFWGIEKEKLFRTIAKGKIELLPGMENFLKTLKEKKVARIIASSTGVENLRFYLKETSLSHYFDSFVSGEEVPIGKPAPDIFIEAAKKLHRAPKECVVLEDSPPGLQAGTSAGAFVVALATTNPIENLVPCHLLYPSPKELDLEEIRQKWTNWK